MYCSLVDDILHGVKNKIMRQSMKQAIKYLCGVSLLALALVACGKKEQEQTTQTQNEEVATPTVVERPPIVCDDVALKNRVVNLVQDQLLNTSLDALGNTNNIAELEQQLRARLAETSIDVQNPEVKQGECHAQLHVVLSDKDVEFANKAFVKAGLPTLAEQAANNNISLLGTGRLVSDFVYQVDGEALAIDKNNPAVQMVANSLAKAVSAMTKQNKVNARKENSAVGSSKPNIVPAPTVNLRPVERPRPPTPEEAILRPEDVPSGKPKQSEATQSTPSQNNAQAQSQESRPEPKPKPKPEVRAESEPKPKAEPKAAVQESHKDDVEITVVETDETY